MKFSIRDVLLVTVIVAILLAWWLDHRRLAARISPRRFIENQVELFDPLPHVPN